MILDKETESLVKTVLILETLSEEERGRVIAYLTLRYIPMSEDFMEDGYSHC